MKKTLWGIILVIIIILVVIFGKTADKQTTDKASVGSNTPFRIGVSLPLTGDFAAFGEEFKRGAELAAKQLNAERPGSVELFIEDTAADPKKALFGIKKLVEVNHIDASLISSYNEIAASWQTLRDAKIPEITLWDSNPTIEDMGDYVFAIGPWTPASGEVPAEYFYNKGARKAAILSFNQEWGVSVSDAFEAKFKALGGTITSKEFPAPGTKDYRSFISKLMKDKPDLVYYPSDGVNQITKQLREAGFKGIFVTSDVLDAEVTRNDPELFNGVYTSQVADPTSPETNAYLAGYKKEFGTDARKIVIGAWGYDGVMAMYKAAQMGSKDGAPSARGDQLRDNLYALDFKGASAHINFDEKGSSKTLNQMFWVEKGEIVPVK